MGIRCQIIFTKLRFCKIRQWETLDTRQRILQKTLKNVAVLESIQSRFELSIHLCLNNFSEPARAQFLTGHSWFAGEKIQRNAWKVQINTAGRFLAQTHPSNLSGQRCWQPD